MKTTSTQFLSLLSLVLLGFNACDKSSSTSISGKVIDQVTGAPVEGALLSTTTKHKGADYFSPDYITVYTNAAGEFDFGARSEPVGIFEVQKEGYLPKGVGGHTTDIVQGQANDVVIELVPKDAWFRLNIEKNAGSPDTVIVRLFSQKLLEEVGISTGKLWRETLDLKNTSNQTYLFNVSSGEYLKIYWGFSPVQYDRLADYPFADSLYITRNDTAIFKLQY